MKGIDMTTISCESQVVTTINVFRVAPELQQRALDMLIRLAQQLIDAVPGLLSANFHVSTDGERIVNYAQYTNKEAVEAVEVKIREIARAEGLALREIAEPDFHTYTVSTIIERA
jgi:3-keto-L-gulonate-6-phosphate decarboxylase